MVSEKIFILVRNDEIRPISVYLFNKVEFVIYKNMQFFADLKEILHTRVSLK